MRTLIGKFVPGFIKRWRNEYLKNRYLRLMKEKPPEKVFEHIYKTKYWGDDESVSGAGSTFQQTEEVRRILPELFKKYNVHSFLDLPCGDFHWMKKTNLDGVDYTGADIVKDMIVENQARYASPKINFKVINLLTDQLPDVDMIMCRDCFIHLSTENIIKGLENIKQSKIKYLLTTSYVDRTQNSDILTGQWRALNLLIAPFNLTPIEIISEKCTEADGIYPDKSLLLIDLDAWRSKAV
jgi:SAM-dependent methyltransferase